MKGRGIVKAPVVREMSDPAFRSFASYCRSVKMVTKEWIVHPLTFRYWPGCIDVDDLTRPQLLELQASRLHGLMKHAINTVPFYRDWAAKNKIDPQAPPGLEDWPITTKADIRADIEAFQSEAFYAKDMSAAKTSGSSGEPFQFRVHRTSTDYSYACLWRSLRRHGLRPGDRRVYIWGRSYEFNSTAVSSRKIRMRQQARNWLNNTHSINAYDLRNSNVDSSIAEIENFRPTYLHGYVTALYAIARRMLDTGRTFRSFAPAIVITESEKLYPFQRLAMQSAFKCPILEHYGAVEFGNIAQPDLEGRLRIADDFVKLETTATGELLVTNLMSLAYPMIRYRLGDLAKLSSPPATDALPYGVIDEIIGRTVDLIPIAARGYVHGVALAHIVDPHLKYVRKYQIHQLAIDRFTVRLASNGTVPEAVMEQIRSDLATLVGGSAAIDVTQVDDIAPAPSGKFRWVLSDVSDVARQVLQEGGSPRR